MRRFSLVDRTLSTVIIVVAVAAMLGAMALSWWARAKRQSGYAPLVAVPTDLGEPLGDFAGLYLATTPAGRPLDRVVVRGLGFRARTTIEVVSEGLVFMGDTFIPKIAISEIGSASWTIDRAVSKDGLSVVSWTLGDQHLDSYFRFDDPTAFLAAARLLTGTGSK